MQGGEDYLLTLYEVCEILGKSTRTITRYVHKHILHPRGVKSRQGTLEYRFSRAEIDAFKQRQDSIRSYVYLDNKPISDPAPVASFADYGYAQSPAQTPFLIPGISYPVRESRLPQNPPKVAQSSDVEFERESPHVVPGEKKEINDFGKPAKETEPATRKEAESALAQKRNDDEIISLLKETTGMLRDQLKVKDDQIKNLDDKVGQLIERNRETNILLKGLQDKIMLLEKPKDGNDMRVQHADADQPSPTAHKFEEPHSPEVLAKDDKNINVPVRVKIFSDPASINNPDKEATIDFAKPPATNSMAPRPSSPASENYEKKGLFGRLFK